MTKTTTNSLYTSIEIEGGLGNRLFQIAYIILFLRLSKTQKIKRKLVFKGLTDPYWNTIFKGLFRVLSDTEYDAISFVNYPDTGADAPYKARESVLLKGLYQSFAYIDDSLREKMISIVYSNEDIMYSAYYKYRDILDYFGKNTKDDDMVALHIHRKTESPLLMRYYKEALRIVNKKKIVVFSDDITWCINNFGDHVNNDAPHDSEDSGVAGVTTDYNIYYLKYDEGERTETDEATEFILMSMFQHNIIANSNFSLWASFISYYKRKIVIAPKHNNAVYHKYITHII
jgi:hypothetical protein